MSHSEAERTLRSVNLNLLPVLNELLRERNVTRAANRLHMTQSAVSEALKRLRAQFDDELLVRVGRQMLPTELALSLAPQIEKILSEIESLLEPKAFDPAKINREFLIATGDTIILAIGSELVRRLAEKAPLASIQFISIQYVTRRDLEEGKVDLIILPRGIVPQSVFDEEGLESMKIYHEDWVCVSRANHPELRHGLTIEAINRTPSVACRLDENSYLYGQLPGRRTPEQLRVSQFMLLPLLIMQSDAIGLVQRHVATWFARHFPIDVFELPIPFPELDVCAYWAAIQRNDPMHMWLRNQIAEIVQDSDSPWLPRTREHGAS